MPNYKLITSKKDIDNLISYCKTTRYCCFDFETNAEPIYSGKMVPTLLSISFAPGYARAIPLNHFESPKWFKDNYKLIIEKIGLNLLENPDIVKVAWNLKFDSQIMALYNIHPVGVQLDGMLAKYLLDEERPMDLKSMVSRYLPEYGGYEDYEGSKLPWAQKPMKGLSYYGCQDADMTLRLTLFFENKLIKLGFYNLYRNLIMMASKVLQNVETTGILLDKDFNDLLIVKYKTLIDECDSSLRNIKSVKRFEKYFIEEKKENYIKKIEGEIDNLDPDTQQRSIKSREDKISNIRLGIFNTKSEKSLLDPVNFGSQKQMVSLLFLSKKGLKLPIIKYTKDKFNKDTETPSTSEDTLILLKQYDKVGFIDNLLKLRGLQTVNSTFVLGIREKLGGDGRIHPKFNIHGTVTGRLSSSDPNFQNLPRSTTNPDIKKMMIPGKDRLFLMMDYSQAELRVLAHMAHEETMLMWFRTGRDIHLATACKKYHVEYDDILPIYQDEQNPNYKLWKKRRKQAKTINFGIAYEQTAFKLAESLSDPSNNIIVTVDEAQLELDNWFKDFPKIKKFIESQHRFAIKHGWVKTLFGRKRRLPGVYSDSQREYLEALRFSSNAPVQGTATDFALFSSILIWEQTKTGELPASLIEQITVHDSIVFSILAKDITVDLIYKLWSICKNPDTEKYFGFKVSDVDMEMDFTVGRNYVEELPFKTNFDYTKMLDKDFKESTLYEYKEPFEYKEYGKKYKPRKKSIN